MTSAGTRQPRTGRRPVGKHDFGLDWCMAEVQGDARLRQLKTPRAAAIAGIVFAVLFAISFVLVRTALPGGVVTDTAWVGRTGSRMSVALTLLPFAGIAFLWFVAVIRDRLGNLEDRFFSTVFLGSGLLFLAMIFTSTAVAGGVLAVSRQTDLPQSSIVYFGREVMLQINNIYALRMAGVFMISLGTIWLRTGLMPRWLAVITYLVALILLLVVSLSFWVTLLFPAWVLLISVFILAGGRHESTRPN
ncbi:hypothetical membrane protein [Rhodococcus opacus B4]|uniref:Hypothetical membrane protein n=2 Tax=Rhodococcus opacus TaxID=37919 RepID=C1B7I8_RHOOB|nr:hypothetical membrane protein [Rhodococcus opacus B4]